MNTKESNTGDLAFNQLSCVRTVPNSDVGFDYKDLQQPSSGLSSTSMDLSTTITLVQVASLRPNQKVNVKAAISLGKEEPRKVEVKTKGDALVKDDCIIEDGTGTATLPLWDHFISRVSSGKSYQFENLVARSFQGNTYLSTTFTTLVKEVEQVVENLTGPELLESKESEVTFPRFELVKKLDVFLACRSCNRKIEDVAEDRVKCNNKGCEARQRKSSCKTHASVELLIELPGKDDELYLTVFTDVLNDLLATEPPVILSSTSTDTIEDRLMLLKNIKFRYNVISKVITKVLQVSM